jgi:hypothetical protein
MDAEIKEMLAHAVDARQWEAQGNKFVPKYHHVAMLDNIHRAMMHDKRLRDQLNDVVAYRLYQPERGTWVLGQSVDGEWLLELMMS